MEKPSSSLQTNPGSKRSGSASLRTTLLLLLTFLAPASFAGVIHEAARSGDLEQIQRLVVKGTAVNEKSSQDELDIINRPSLGFKPSNRI